MNKITDGQEFNEMSQEKYEYLLKEKREKIDKLDQIIVETLVTRMEVAQEIGQLKKQQEAALYDEQRENRLMERVFMLAKSAGMPESEAQDIFGALYKLILEKSKEHQQRGLQARAK